MMCGGNALARNPRMQVDERALFERLWRGALCRTINTNGRVIHNKNLHSIPRQIENQNRSLCCCHCHCVQLMPNINQYDENNKTMRSVVRYVVI